MADTEVVEQPQQQVEQPAQQVVSSDPFALDENSLASLSPEQRASLDPIIDSWKKRATEEITKRESSAAEKYKPYEEKAAALEKLTAYQPFVQWWQQQQRAAQSMVPQQQAQAIGQSQPQQFGTPQEWQEAVLEASNGDASKLQAIQAKMMAAWATPWVQQMNQKHQVLETQIQLKDLFERHPEAKTLDQIGLNEKGEGTSLLEQALDWAERNNKSLEDGFQLANKWYSSMKAGAQQQAMGLVNGKKQEVTAGPSTSIGGRANVVEVADADELIKRSMEAQLSGQKDVRFVIKH